MTDPHQPVPPPESQGMVPAQDAAPAGSMLHLRDVQALNRSFRRLSEVQQALLEQFEAVEEDRRRQRKWLLPLLGAAGLLLGVGSLAVGLGVLFGEPPDPIVEVAAPELPEIIIPTPEITLQAPENDATVAAIEALRTEIAAMRNQSDADRSRIAELQDRLFTLQQENLQALKMVGAAGTPGLGNGDPPREAPAAGDGGQESAGTSSELPDGLSEALANRPDPWIGVANGLLSVDGYGHLRFEKGERVPGEPELREATLLEYDEAGLLDAIVRAGTCRFELHQMTRTLVLRLSDGTRTKGGVKTPLPSDGLRFDLVQVSDEAWLSHMPELGLVSGPSVTSAPMPTEAVREALDQLVSHRRPVGYYRLASLEDVEGNSLRMVQLQRYDGGGRLVRTLEADSLEVFLHPTGDVELLLRNGAIQEGGQRRPFYEDRYRVYLPRQPLDDWRRSGVPFEELP